MLSLTKFRDKSLVKRELFRFERTNTPTKKMQQQETAKQKDGEETIDDRPKNMKRKNRLYITCNPCISDYKTHAYDVEEFM